MIEFGGAMFNPEAVDYVDDSSGALKILMRSGDWISIRGATVAEFRRALNG